MPLNALGGAPALSSLKCIRLVLHGCANRPFYHIVVMGKRRSIRMYPVIEQLGTYDPMTNIHGEKLLSLNIERIMYWLGTKTVVSAGCAELLGAAGVMPIHPRTYIFAWRARREIKLKQLEENQEFRAEN